MIVLRSKWTIFWYIFHYVTTLCTTYIYVQLRTDLTDTKRRRSEYCSISKWGYITTTSVTVYCLLPYLLLTYLLNLLHGAESFLRSQLVLQLIKNSPHYMEPQSSSPYSQAPATCPYPEPTPSSPHTPFPLHEDPS